METKLFAVMDHRPGGRIKIIRLQETLSRGAYSHTLTAYIPRHESDELTLSMTNDTDANLVGFTLSSGRIQVWRTGWTVNHMNTWIQLLDSDDRESLPGNFLFRCKGAVNYCLNDQLNLRLDIMTQLYGYLPIESPPVSADVPSSTNEIPRFVAEIMKKEAISKNEACSISFESFAEVPVSITSCFHLFQTESINLWLQTNNSCPLCKAPVNRVQAV